MVALPTLKLNSYTAASVLQQFCNLCKAALLVLPLSSQPMEEELPKVGRGLLTKLGDR